MRMGTRPPLSRPDARESVRLELVALAAEVATLATRIQEESCPWLPPGELDEVLAGAQDLHDKAAEVLAFDSLLHDTDAGELQTWLTAFRSHQRQAAQLRGRVARQRPRRAKPPRLGLPSFFQGG